MRTERPKVLYYMRIMGSPEKKVVANLELLLLVPLLLALAARHLCLYHQGVDVAHLGQVLDRLARIIAGDIWVEGPEFWVFQVGVTGSIFFWLHLPLLLFDDMVLGLHVTYLIYEAAGLLFWVLLGLRGGVDRRLVWLGAAGLALYWDHGTQLAENIIIAHYLAPPIFMATLVAWRRGTMRAMALAGLLLALAGQIHPVALVILPALIGVAFWRSLGRPWRMAGGLLLGLGAGYLLALGGMIAPAKGGMGELMWGILNGDPARLPQHLANTPLDILALLGLLLVLVRAVRRRPMDRPGLLAALWLLTAMPLLIFAIAHLDHGYINEYRYAALKPCRAMLSAVFLIGVADAMSSFLRSRFFLDRGRLVPVLSWTVVLAIAAMLKAPQAPACAFDLVSLDRTQPRQCRPVQLHRMSFAQAGFQDHISRLLAGEISPGQAYFWGTWSRPLNVLLRARELTAGLADTPQDPGDHRTPILVFPRSPEVARLGAALSSEAAGVSTLRGVRRLPLKIVLPGRRYSARIPGGAGSPQGWLLAVRAYRRHGDPGPFKLHLRSGGKVVPPLVEVPCLMEHPAAHALYQVSASGNAGSELRLEITSKGEGPRLVSAILLRFSQE